LVASAALWVRIQSKQFELQFSGNKMFSVQT
jgi:hypothetical protein